MNTTKKMFKNGKIFTSNRDQKYADAMIIDNGIVEWIGQADEIHDFNGEVIDLNNRRVLPGIIDAHMHPLMLANATKQIACTPPVVYSIKDMIEELSKKAVDVSEIEWIEGWGYDEGKLKEGRTPNRHDLDEVSLTNPIVITRTCGHIVSVNSKALAFAGITKETPDPAGGQIDRDENGEPTGILRESARLLVLNKMPQLSMDENASRLAELTESLYAHGITAITDLMASHKPMDYLDMYNLAREKGLSQNVVLYYMWEDLRVNPVLNDENTNRKNPIHIGGVKLFADGSVSGKTAWVNPAFLGDENNYGISTTSEEELLEAAAYAKKHKVQLVVHAMGEQAIDLIVNTFYGVEGWVQDGPSIRIEHVAMPTTQALERASTMSIAFVPQPIFLYAEIESYINNLGAERTKTTYPVNKMLEAGIPVAFSSDAPATAWADPVNPFVGIKSAVTRVAYKGTNTGESEKVDVETAIELYTRCAQQITRIPHIGQLKSGYQADFIILNNDILEISPEEIDQINVDETYVKGNSVYKKNYIMK
ncbi:amidohydrolase [Psychrobacillus vulpis]|uniref:Amidohydrolase n=1 Tax=Psychrobacillus vulpis TaxID=2325572 RepID=A0A544TT24_9BACI|nr:amidohydrolase [Psychrobacillus vulpis]TQR20606.1 amidohydrolase [Psychrobacillus vulpis]